MLHTSGSSIVGDRAAGTRSNNIYEDDTPFEPLPGKVACVAIDRLVRESAKNGVPSTVICPTLIYGRGHGVHKDSIQVPKLIALAKQHGVGKHVGPGENIWSNVHIDDLVTLYLLALEKTPAGAFHFAENGENAWRDVAAAISRLLGYGGKTESIPIEQAVKELGEVMAYSTFGSNSRVRAVRARKELGWKPNGRPLLPAPSERCPWRDGVCHQVDVFLAHQRRSEQAGQSLPALLHDQRMIAHKHRAGNRGDQVHPPPGLRTCHSQRTMLTAPWREKCHQPGQRRESWMAACTSRQEA